MSLSKERIAVVKSRNKREKIINVYIDLVGKLKNTVTSYI
jgi:hypothetical protein